MSEVQETPRSSTVDGKYEKITNLRTPIATEMDEELLTCPVGDFISHYIPFAPSDEDVTQFIERNLGSLLCGSGDDLRFTWYTKPPQPKVKEAVDYKDFEKIASVIRQHISETENRTIETGYKDCPHDSLSSDIHDCNNKIDTCFMVNSKMKKRPIHTTDIIVPIEFKTSKSDRIKNNIQVVSMNVQIMNDDPRRMFAFGITMEADEVTLWFHSRSHSAFSKPSNFITNPRLLIKIFMAFFMASREQLGYDPKVTLNEDHSYTYEIPNPPSNKPGSRFFRAWKHLSFIRSNNTTGRMPCIWLVKAQECVGPGIFTTIKNAPDLVLKDVWLDHAAKTENEILDSIFDDIKKFWSCRREEVDAKLQPLWTTHESIVENDDFKKYFLTMVTHDAGETSKAVAEKSECTAAVLLADIIPLAASKSKQSLQVPGVGDIVSSEPTGSSVRAIWVPSVTRLRRAFTPRKQYRVVFKEVCETVENFATVGDVVTALSAVLTPLQLLLAAGWVHRDISGGNIMVYRKDGQVKLADLEYAKKFPKVGDLPPAIDPKTGTPYFMPLEIMQQKLLYHPEQTEPMAEDQEAVNSLFDTMVSALNNTAVLTVPSVIHNFQHDLESIFWILLWTVTGRPKFTGAHAWSRQVFQNEVLASLKRHEAFTDDLIEPLSGILDPSLRPCLVGLNALRKMMVNEYKTRAEHSQLDDVPSYIKISQYFSTVFFTFEKYRSYWDRTPLIVGHTVHIITEPGVLVIATTPTASASSTIATASQTSTPNIATTADNKTSVPLEKPRHAKRPRNSSEAPIPSVSAVDPNTQSSNTSGKRSRR